MKTMDLKVGPSFLLQVFAVFKIAWSQSLEFDTILPDNPQEYDNLQPPKHKGEATVVRFHVTVLSLDTIDEGSMTYVADIFMSQSWKDHRLRLPENMTMKYRLLPVGWLKRMWRPDSFFKNAKRVTFQEMTIPNHYIWLYSDKTILYMVKLTLLLSCAMKFEAYPHDTQTCTMKIESLSYTTDDLVFDWEEEVPLVVDDSIELPQHNLVDTTLGDCTKHYSTGNFTCIEVVFTLKRRLGYYMFHTYIPTCLIVIMSWISFWIKPEAVPARVTLCVTSLLTLSTQHAQSQKSLPPVSYIKAIDIFMSSCTVFVFASLMEYALVNILLGEGAEDSDEDGRRTQPQQVQVQPQHSPPLPNGTKPKLISSVYRHNRHRHRAILVDKISRVIFPLSFVILNTAYWSVYLDTGDGPVVL
ncbi:glycine receptor subunit alpha-2-like [Argiope bruennichi]|uniref:glycine receptor subunit alpha-2-like n=1 Tax=Argiope bruennichi TaxID=94029 RepID=UPI00249568EA|nr:glycine receptor subunit alpha-2-like [Argiope bruennichi]